MIRLCSIFSDTDIRILQGTSAAEILSESRDVIQTKGEWELVGIEAALSTLEVEEGTYSSIKYFVSSFIIYHINSLYIVSLKGKCVVFRADFQKWNKTLIAQVYNHLKTFCSLA